MEQRARLAKHKEELERDLAAVQLPSIVTSDAEIETLEAAAKSKVAARERECLRPGPICINTRTRKPSCGRSWPISIRAAQLTTEPIS
jgi:hypothetical protein